MYIHTHTYIHTVAYYIYTHMYNAILYYNITSTDISHYMIL